MRSCLNAVIGCALAIFVSGASYIAGFSSSALVTHFTAPPPAATAAVPIDGSLTDRNRQLGVFWEVWDILRREYYGRQLSPEEMTAAAISGVVDSLGDPHTAYLDARHARIFSDQLSGSFEGIGAYVEMRGGQLIIVSPLANTPAERAGLRAGDVVVAIDDEPVDGLSLTEAITRIRGPRGTTVRLTVIHPGESAPVTLEIVRDRISVPTVESRRLADGKIGYIHLFEFNDRAPQEVRLALQDLMRDRPQGLILDLRDDPGGYLHVAVDIAGQFLEGGLVLTERQKDGTERQYTARRGGLATTIPLVVLVNKGSASASEILAGALQDRGRARLVGEKTFGKGSVQIAHDLSDGSNLRVTVAQWFTPGGRNINEQGLQPDVEVTMEGKPAAGRPDPQLDRALQLLLSSQ